MQTQEQCSAWPRVLSVAYTLGCDAAFAADPFSFVLGPLFQGRDRGAFHQQSRLPMCVYRTSGELYNKPVDQIFFLYPK